MPLYDDGFARGKLWAQRGESAAALRNLRTLHAGKTAEDWRHWFVGQDAGRTAFKRFVQVLLPQTSVAQAEVAGFWRDAVTFDADLPQRVVQQGDFVQGFADGALGLPHHYEDGPGHDVEPDEDWLDEHGGPTTANDT